MKFFLGTYYAPSTLRIAISCEKECTVFIEVEDLKTGALISKRSYLAKPSGVDKIYIQAPLTGNNLLVSVFEDATDKEEMPKDFKVVLSKTRVLPLVRTINVLSMTDKMVEWISFAEKFSFNARWLPTWEENGQKYYISANGNYRIKYLDRIITDGAEDVTPARIDNETTIIEASKAKIITMTVPGIFAVLGHEHAHMFENVDEASELESDLNAIEMCLSLGFPKYEIKQVFLNTFMQPGVKDNQEIHERLFAIEDFINRYESLEIEHL